MESPQLTANLTRDLIFQMVGEEADVKMFKERAFA
jgi:hypothetical protein